MAKGHAEALAPMVETVMAEAGLELAALDRIAVTTGPGTFTGLRIALSFARGLGLALNKPVLGVSSLEAMALRAAAGNSGGLPIVAAIDARREEAYCQMFDAAGMPQSAPAVMALDGITLPAGPVRIIGSAARLLARAGDETDFPACPDMRIVALAAAAWPDPGHPPHPLYLRASDAKPRLQLQQGVSLVPAVAAHAEILARLHQGCFPESWNAADFAGLLANPATLGRIAMGPDGEPMAFLLVSRVLDEAEILTLAVLPGHRRKGVASLLLARFGEELGSLGVGRLHLEVAAGNAPARALYAAAGFAEAGRRKAYYGNGEDALLLSRAC